MSSKEYSRRYYLEHREERKKYFKEYYRKKREELLRKFHNYYLMHRSEIIQRERLWQMNNKDKVNLNNKRYYWKNIEENRQKRRVKGIERYYNIRTKFEEGVEE